jgi:spore coat polysaccharide biosynthesis protein SpsF
MKIVATITARMTSARLPGKVLMPCVGQRMLELLVERVRRSRLIDHIVISTTVNRTDDAVEACARNLGVGCFRGSEEDVVGRVVGAMEVAQADIVVQLTGDCPLLDWEVIDQLIRLYQANKFDYVSNTLVRSYPRGLDCQIVSLAALQESLRIAKDAAQHEHVCLSIYENPQRFSLFNLMAPPELCYPGMRWTLDTEADYQFLTAVYEQLYPDNPAFTSADVVRLLREHPEIEALNSEIQQKAIRQECISAS